MSRSRKKTPVTGYAKARSVQGYKHLRVSEERARQRALISRFMSEGEIFEPFNYDLAPWDEWQCERDGKWRFDPKKYPKLMRK